MLTRIQKEAVEINRKKVTLCQRFWALDMHPNPGANRHHLSSPRAPYGLAVATNENRSCLKLQSVLAICGADMPSSSLTQQHCI